MRNRSTRVSAYMAVTSLGLAAALIQPAAAYAGDTTASPHAAPRGQGCSPYKKFVIAHKSFPDLGDRNNTAWTWLKNHNAHKGATLSLSFAAESSVGESVTATASVDAGVIFAKVSASLAVGITHTHGDTETKTSSVSVPAHEFGVLGADILYAKVTGTYKTLQDGPGGKCRKRVVKNVIGEFPTKDPTGFEAGVTKKAPVRPPWPLAPR